MNKVWRITIKYTSKGKDLWGRPIDGQSRTWYTDIDNKSERIAKGLGRKEFEKSAEFEQCLKINSVRSAFVREY